MSHILYVDNTGYIQLEGYKNGLTGEYINDAIVTAEFITKDGSTVNGILPVVSLTYESNSNGNYSASVSENAEWLNGDIISVKVTAISSGIKSTFNCKLLIRDRGC